MCAVKNSNIDFSSLLQQPLLFQHISDPYLIQRTQPLPGSPDDPCSWGGKSWSFCSDVVSHDRQQCGKEVGGAGVWWRKRKATEGPTRSSRKPSQTEGTSLSCCFLPVLLASWAIRSPLFPMSLLVNCSCPYISSKGHSLQLLQLMSFFFFI